MDRESRRSFLKRTGRVGAASVLARLAAGQGVARGSESPETLPALTSRPSTPPPERSAKSVVAEVRRTEVVDGPRIHPTLLREMIEEGLCAVTERSTAGDAWNRLLAPNDVIGVKFNQVGAAELGTSVPFAMQLVESLRRADVPPERIILIEAPDDPSIRRLKTRPHVVGFSGGQVSFGSGAEELAAVLQEITAIINVPLLKTHNIAGMTGCLKNLSHALIRRPGRYHAHACAPYVGRIVALPPIRSKLKVHIVNALRVVFRGGPAVETDSFVKHGGVLVSTDPVAADQVGTEIINDLRGGAKLPPIGDPDAHIPHVHAAADLGLGTDDQDYILPIRPGSS